MYWNYINSESDASLFTINPLLGEVCWKRLNSDLETRLPIINAFLSNCIENLSKLSLRATMQNRFLSSRLAWRNDWLWAWGVIAVSQNCMGHQSITRLRRDCPSKAYSNEINSEVEAWLSSMNAFLPELQVHIYMHIYIYGCAHIYIYIYISHVYILNVNPSWASDMTVQKQYYSSRFASRSDQLWAWGVIAFL